MTSHETLKSILQHDIFNDDSSTYHMTLISSQGDNLPVRPLHIPIMFVPLEQSSTRLQRAPASSAAPRTQQNCLFIATDETPFHYHSLYQKMNRKRASFQVVDLWGELVSHDSENPPSLVHFLKSLLTQQRLQDISTLVIPSLHTLTFYYSLTDIISFIKSLPKLFGNLNNLVLDMQRFHGENVDELYGTLSAMANVMIQVEGLESGYSKDVHGLMRIVYTTEHSTNTPMHVREKLLQYKVTDREVKIFGKGHRGLF